VICLLSTFAVVEAQTVDAPSNQKPTIQTPIAETTSRVAGDATIYCAGYIRQQKFSHLPQLVGGLNEQSQRTFSQGDIVYLDAGSQDQIQEGQEFQVIRPRGDVKKVYTSKHGFLGTYVEEVGQLKVFKVREHTSAARITFSCDAVLLGDLVTAIPNRELPLTRPDLGLDLYADPTGKQIGRLMMAHGSREMVSTRDVVYIDLGAEDNINAGDYLTIYRPLGTGNLTRIDNEEGARGRSIGFQSDRYRGGGFGIQAQRDKDSTAFVDADGRYRYRPITTKEIKRLRPQMPRQIVGEMVVIDVQSRTATAIITQVAGEVHTGDWVEVK
jgi:hypothetical protein